MVRRLLEPSREAMKTFENPALNFLMVSNCWYGAYLPGSLDFNNMEGVQVCLSYALQNHLIMTPWISLVQVSKNA